jgi:anti-sigma factor ChrR (cupin superfamily)
MQTDVPRPVQSVQDLLNPVTSLLLHGLIRPDFEFDSLDWQPYGADQRRGVEIVRLYDTRGAHSNGSAAALLRYTPGAKAARHLHPGYELIFVLQGELINDAGTHPAGTLEICPPGSSHALASATGCVFLVVWEQPVQVLVG